MRNIRYSDSGSVAAAAARASCHLSPRRAKFLRPRPRPERFYRGIFLGLVVSRRLVKSVSGGSGGGGGGGGVSREYV